MPVRRRNKCSPELTFRAVNPKNGKPIRLPDGKIVTATAYTAKAARHQMKVATDRDFIVEQA